MCWYTGKSLYERLGGKVPVGLLKASVELALRRDDIGPDFMEFLEQLVE